jgi:hypothetical protein
MHICAEFAKPECFKAFMENGKHRIDQVNEVWYLINIFA